VNYLNPYVRAFRARHLRLFDSTCTVTGSGDSETVWDEEAKEYVTPPRTVYRGRCKLLAQAVQARVVQAGARAVSLFTYELYVPHDVPVRLDMRVHIDSSPDPQAAGLDLRVIDVPRSDWVVARKLIVEEVGRVGDDPDS
jgi:hypothetical protein